MDLNNDPNKPCNNGARSVFVNTRASSLFNNNILSKVTAAYVYTTNSDDSRYVTKVGNIVRS